VRFRHIGGHNIVATRPATKAGAFRVYRGLDEVHEVENLGNAPSRFLRVELKTAALDPAAFKGKFERSAASVEPTVHFDHPQVKVSRIWATPGSSTRIVAGSAPVLVIALNEGASYRLGQERWLASGTSVQIENTSAAPVDFLRFDLKTDPPATRQ
jgi:hypothetical protein